MSLRTQDARRNSFDTFANVCGCLAGVVATILHSGCNNAMTLRNNFDRAKEARRAPDAPRRDAADDSRTAERPTASRLFPPFKRTESAEDYGNRTSPYAPPRDARRTPAARPAVRRETDGPIFPQLVPAHDGVNSDEDGEIQQTSAEFPASPTGVVAGRVVDSNGRPHAGVTVVATASRRPSGTRVESQSDRQGGFVLRGLEPGQRYLVLATATNSREPLIGRVAATAPDHGLVIEIARPFSATRSTPPATDRVASREKEPKQPLAPPPRVAERPAIPQRDTREPQQPGAYANTIRSPGGAAPSAAAPRPPRKKSLSDVISENRRESPWNMPAPPQRRSPPQVAAAPNAEWQPAGERNRSQDARIAPSRLDRFPTDRPLGDTPALESNDWAATATSPNDSPPTEQPTRSPPIVDPSRPLSQPLDLAAESTPKTVEPPSEAATPSALKIDLEGDSPHGTSAAEPLVYTGPKCEFDGNRLVDFQLPDLDGKPVAFSRVGGRLVLVDFWGTWCTYCVKSIPHLASLERRYGRQGLQVVGIAYEQGPASERVTRVREVRDQLDVNYPILLGDIGSCPVHEKFGIQHYPTLVLLDKSGRVLWRREGPDQKDLQQLEKLLKSQLANAP